MFKRNDEAYLNVHLKIYFKSSKTWHWLRYTSVIHYFEPYRKMQLLSFLCDELNYTGTIIEIPKE